MKELPVWLLITGGIVILIAACFKSKCVPIITAFGYPPSFGVGYILQKDAIDAGGATTNNMWIIWIITFALIILAGVGVERIRFIKDNQHCLKI